MIYASFVGHHHRGQELQLLIIEVNVVAVQSRRPRLELEAAANTKSRSPLATARISAACSSLKFHAVICDLVVRGRVNRGGPTRANVAADVSDVR